MIGATTSQVLDLTLINKGDVIYGTSTIKVEIGLKIGSTIEYIPIGIYNIDDIEKNDYTVKITAYDNMIKFERNFVTDLGDTLTLQQVVSELTRITGVEFTGSLPSYTVKKLEGFSCREILGYVASICGGNAVITRDGKFTILTPKEVSYSIGTDNYFEYQREEIKYKIGKISCQVGEEILSKGSLGSDSMELAFENPWVNSTILTDIYNKLNGFEYLGYSMKWQGDLSLDVGDIVTITDKKGVVRKQPILSQKFTYTGGLTSEIGAKGETKNKNSFSSSGSTANKVNRVVAELLIVNEALINKANIQDLEAVSIRTEMLEVKTATIEEAIIKKANIEDLNAINAVIENLKAVDLTAINAKIANLQADKANITDLTATNIKFNVGSGGTLDLQTLLAKHITGENGQFINISSSNTVIANAVIKDAMIENVSLKKVLAGTISTNKFTISSDDGGITIVGPTMQFKDKNNRVRIQMGQDAIGNFNFILRGEDGTTTLIDHTGIKEKAIADDLIKSNMVAENAIGEKQINYSSLITGLNKDTNTSLIKASKVAIDLTGQSLEVSFNSLKSNVDGIQVGGRNLLKNSNEIYLTGSDYPTITKRENGKITVLSSGAFNAYNFIQSKFSKPINELTSETGKSFTMSVDIRTTNLKTDNVKLFLNFRGSSGKMTENFVVLDKNKNGSWYRVSVTIKTIDINYPLCLFSITTQGIIDDYSGLIIEYKNWKFEEGNKATDYTVAPEDIDSKIESNTTAITVAQGKIEGLISENSIIKGYITTISDKYTSLKATVDGINTTVASHTSSITTIKNTADSALNNANNANSKIDGLEVGGRNLVILSNIQNYAGGSLSNNKYYSVSGTKITATNQPLSSSLIGFKVYTDNTFVYTVSGYTNLSSVNVYFRCYNSSDTIIQAQVNVNATVENGKFILTFSNIPINTYYFNIGIGSVSVSNYYIDKLKLEKGNKATDYTVSPEDVDSSISDVNTKVTTVENKYTTLEQNLEGFKTTVSNTYSTKTEVSNLSGTVSSINSRVSTAESSITQLNNKIDLKVEATDVTEAINNIQVGGRNLIKDSTNIFLTGSDQPSVTKRENGKITVITSGKFNAYKFVTSNMVINLSDITNIIGKKFTMSVDVRTTNLNVDDIRVYFDFRGTGKKMSESYAVLDKNKNGIWYRVSASLEIIDTQYPNCLLCITSHKSSAVDCTGLIIEYKNWKLEEGNKATDYTVAPEDIDSSISTVSNKVATIETNFTSITSRVSSTETSIATINGNVSSLQSRMSSAEQKITDSAIIATVSGTYLSKTDATNTYATKSSLTQTESSIIAKFTASGGYNLLKNSNFANKQIDNWWTWGGVFRWADENYYKDIGDMYIANPNSNNPGGLWQSNIPIKYNTKYTLSVSCSVEPNVKGTSFVLEYVNGSGSVISSQQITLNLDGKRNSYTFTTLNNSSIKYVNCGFRHEGSNYTSGGYLVKINKPCLAEGEVSVWSPNPFEIKDGSTMIDASGVTIYNGAIRVKNNAGVTVLEGDSNGDLTLKGTIVTTAGSIGGFSIKNGAIYGNNVGMGVQDYNWAFWAGSNTSSSAPFRVGHAGEVIATNVTINNGGLTIKNNAGQVMLQGDGNGDLTFRGKLQPNDYQLKLFGNDCKIDGSANAIRMQLTSNIYISVDNAGGLRLFNQHSNGGTRYTSLIYESDGHTSLYNNSTRLKLLGGATPQLQARNTGDNAYVSVAGSQFINASSIEYKTCIENADLDFIKILKENNIKKYKFKEEVERLNREMPLTGENAERYASHKVGFILEELTEEARMYLNPNNTDGIDTYSMCALLWGIVKEQQNRIEKLEMLL